MKQMSVHKISKKDTEQMCTKPHIEKHRNLPFTYWVKSFNPKQSQLFYMVILSDDNVHCSCEGFKYQGQRLGFCKHLMAVLEYQTKVL